MSFSKLERSVYEECICQELKSITPDNQAEEIWGRIHSTLEARQQRRPFFSYLLLPGGKKGLALAVSMIVLFSSAFIGTQEMIMYKKTNNYLDTLVGYIDTETPLVEDTNIAGTF